MVLFSSKKTSLKVLFVASEAAPFAKVGGLGEIMFSLPRALRNLGHDARLIIPRYAHIDGEKFKLEVELGGLDLGTPEMDPYGILKCNILRHDGDGGAITYLIENMEYYEKRANIYGYGDDTMRWALLSKGTLEFLKRSQWKPDVIVASDWEAGFVPNYLHTEYKDDPQLKDITTIFSIHNLRYQGMFDPKFVNEMDYDSGEKDIPPLLDENIMKLNGMRRGIRYADVINTVSPTYAREILTEDFGESLNDLLGERKARLFGVLNGIDEKSLNPETDPDLSAHYTSHNFSTRKENKIALQKQFGISVDVNKFVAGYVGRLDDQKGLDILVQMAHQLLENLDLQIVVVGEGSSQYRVFFEDLKKRFPENVGVHFAYDTRLPRMIFSGADVVLVPSKFEPCGLVQMEAMRYGAVPVVRKVGGLADSVKDFNAETGEGTGFVFEKYDPFSLTIAMVRAYEIHKQKDTWNKIVKNAMTEDFSWTKSAKEYLKLFEMAVRFHKER